MIKKLNLKFKVKNEIIALTILIILTSIFTIYHNQTKNKIKDNYKKIIENFFFKKTVNHFFQKFEPRFKKISHKVQEGETVYVDEDIWNDIYMEDEFIDLYEEEYEEWEDEDA